MQLYCKDGVVVAYHDDGQSVPASAYGEGVDIVTFEGPLSTLGRDGPEPTVGAIDDRPFAAPPIDLALYAAAKRYAVETGGILVNGAPIATDRQSQAMIGNAYAYVQASGAASVSYKTAAGFVTLAAEQIKAVALAVGAHVQACFAAEDAVDAAIHASPPTIASPAQVDAAFASLITPSPA